MSTQSPYWVWTSSSQRADDAHGPSPCVFGALPYVRTPPNEASEFIDFRFTSFNPSILNCAVAGPAQRMRFYVITDPTNAPFTIFKQVENGENIAVIEWGAEPKVEVRGTYHKQLVSEFIPLSQDQHSRVMTFADRQYAWVPERDQIYLFKMSGTRRQLVARISNGVGRVTLQIAQIAFEAGLLLHCLVGTVLLCSERAID